MTTHISFSEDQRDCLQEIVNVAIGQAGDSLARFIGVFVNLSVPRIKPVAQADLGDAIFEMLGREEELIATRQQFTCPEGKFRGEGVVLFTPPSYDELVRLRKPSQATESLTTPDDDLLLETTDIINSTCLARLAEQINVTLQCGKPALIGKRVKSRELVASEPVLWSDALLVEINYTLEEGSFRCNWLLLMPSDSLESLKDALDKLLADL
jgi:chemotaxis protein CheY-P-specific phosphatase CheC